jgi:hypothetical protein
MIGSTKKVILSFKHRTYGFSYYACRIFPYIAWSCGHRINVELGRSTTTFRQAIEMVVDDYSKHPPKLKGKRV